uniref:Uncharacterized protein n=1 Tax=Chryseobacterium endophyticum TaxID=1854762 RepID=A0AAU6WQ34_9FLAO
MITTEQEQQVTDYLIFHRLPLDILLEVKDHMISRWRIFRQKKT